MPSQCCLSFSHESTSTLDFPPGRSAHCILSCCRCPSASVALKCRKLSKGYCIGSVRYERSWTALIEAPVNFGNPEDLSAKWWMICPLWLTSWQVLLQTKSKPQVLGFLSLRDIFLMFYCSTRENCNKLWQLSVLFLFYLLWRFSQSLIDVCRVKPWFNFPRIKYCERDAASFQR